jgi:uncharacterized BrkB/YihY/UPF0761 family membrane protein
MEKLLVLFGLVQKARSRRLFQRALFSMLLMAVLVFVMAILLSAAIIGGLIAGAFALMQSGIGTPAVVIIVALSGMAIIGVVFLLMMAVLNHLRAIPQKMLMQSPLTSRAIDTLEAFTDGLMAE